MENKRNEKQKIVSKMHYNNCVKYRKNKNKKDNEYNKIKYHTDMEFRTKRLEYLKNLRNDAEFRAKSAARVKIWREAKRLSQIDVF